MKGALQLMGSLEKVPIHLIELRVVMRLLAKDGEWKPLIACWFYFLVWKFEKYRCMKMRCLAFFDRWKCGHMEKRRLYMLQ